MAQSAYSGDGVPAASGTVAHAAIAQLLPLYPGSEPVPIVVIAGLVRDMCAGLGASLNARRVSVTAIGATAKYLNLLRPTLPECEFMSSEIRGPSSRPDLLFRVGSQFLFDEIKTGKFLKADAVRSQVLAHVEAGLELFNSAFAGVRVVATAGQRESLFISPDGVVSSLAESAFAFPQMRASSELHRMGAA